MYIKRIEYYHSSYQGGQRGQQGRPQQYRQGERKKFEFNPDFFDEANNINIEWLDKKAQELANDLADWKLSTSQLRNFYNEFLRIQNIPQEAKNQKVALIKLLKAKAKYKEMASGSEKFPKLFTLFIHKLVDEIGHDIERFNNACLIMEALIGFSPKK